MRVDDRVIQEVTELCGVVVTDTAIGDEFIAVHLHLPADLRIDTLGVVKRIREVLRYGGVTMGTVELRQRHTITLNADAIRYLWGRDLIQARTRSYKKHKK